MKTIQQLLRQPGKSLADVALVALATAILAVCAGQFSSTRLTRADLEDNYSTVGLLTEKFNGTTITLPQMYTDWLEETAAAHPELVALMSDSLLLSSYIPELTPDNCTGHRITGYHLIRENCGIPYTCALLEVVLTDIPDEAATSGTTITQDDISTTYVNKYSLHCRGTVERVVALQEGFRSPEGYTIDITFTAASEEALAAMELAVGQRYLVYGMDYFDADWEFRCWACVDQANFEQPFDANKIYDTSPDGQTAPSLSAATDYYYENTVGTGEEARVTYQRFSSELLLNAQNCSLTVCDFSSLPWPHIVVIDSNATVEMIYDQRMLIEDPDYIEVNNMAGCRAVPAEEYIADYALPTVVRLDGTAEEFLASAEADLWRQALADLEVNNHAFPVLAVDKLYYQSEFARGQARVVEGRDFTQAELESGARVCVIAQSLAAANGLTVGDTISLRTMELDFNFKQNEDSWRYFFERYPTALFYSRARGFSGEAEEYTIVGLYRLENAWSYDSNYGFTPNTLFIPKAAAAGDSLSRTDGVFRTLVLHNGARDAFQALVQEAGYSGLLVYYDQGYSEIVEALDAYESVSGRALYIGIGACAVLLALFLFLFSAQQRKTLTIMSTLGAARGTRLAHVVKSGLVILALGTAAGAAAGTLLMDRVTAELMSSVSVSITMASAGTVVPIAAAAQFLTAAALLFLIALPATSQKDLMNRK